MTENYGCEIKGGNCPYKNSDTNCPRPGNQNGCYVWSETYAPNSVETKTKKKSALEEMLRR